MGPNKKKVHQNKLEQKESLKLWEIAAVDVNPSDICHVIDPRKAETTNKSQHKLLYNKSAPPLVFNHRTHRTFDPLSISNNVF